MEELIVILLVVVVIQLFFALKWMGWIERKLDAGREQEAAADMPRKIPTPREPEPTAEVGINATERKITGPPPVALEEKPAEPAAKFVPEKIPAPQVPQSAAEPRKPGAFEFALSWIADWVCVRGKYRKQGVSAEYAVATAWLIRAGVLILLFGIGFLAKYMIDHSVFPPALRTAGMFLLAAALFAVGVRMAKTSYSSIALGLIGLSFATGYLSVVIGSRLYGLIGAPSAYAAMIVLTAFFMTFSVRRDYPFPALIGVLGGYLTPFLLNSRDLAPQWQLGYLTVMTAGVLFCAFFRSWNFNCLALVFAYLAQAGIVVWFGHRAGVVKPAFGVDCNIFQTFILLNFVLFALLPTVWVLIRRKKLELPDILVHCGAHVVLFLLTLLRFTQLDASDFALRYIIVAAAALALVQLPLMRIADRTDRNWKVLQLIFAAGALLALIPLEFSALCIVTGWVILALILLALGIGLNSVTLMIGAMFSGAAAGLRVLFHDLLAKGFFLSENYLTGLEPRLMGIGVFIAGLLLAIGMMVYGKRKYPAVFARMPLLNVADIGVVGLSLLFLYSSLELFWMLRVFLPTFKNGGLSLWWGIWAISLLLSGILTKRDLPRRLSLILFGVCALKIFLIDLESLHALYKVAAFLVLGLLMLGGAILYTRFRDRIFKA